MPVIIPFENESETFEIGGLTVENRVDKVSIYGSLDITKDKAGLALANEMSDTLLQILAALKKADLPEAITSEELIKKKNPFE